MKINIHFFVLLILISDLSFSQNPTYTLDVNDRSDLNNSFEFDIDMTWTNSGVVPNFEYAGGTYFFDFNKGIANGGTMTMSIVDSDLPVNMRPRNPTVYTTTTPGQLRLAVNTFPGAGNGYQMPPNIQVKIVRLKFTTTSYFFANEALNLAWRNALPSPFTKIFAYVGTTGTDISTPNTHSISIPNNPFPAWTSVPLHYPMDDGGIYQQPIAFVWGKIDGATFYELQLTSSTISIIDTVQTDTSVTLNFPVSEDSSEFHWRVIAFNSLGVPFGISEMRTFKPKFEVVNLALPVNGVVFAQQPVSFKWRKLANVKNYVLQLATNAQMTNPIFRDSLITDTIRIVDLMFQLDEMHYWQVLGKDSLNNYVAVSEVRSFTPKYSIYLNIKCAVQAMLNPIPGKMTRTDTFKVYLRNNYAPYDIVDSAFAPVDSNTLIGNFKFVYATPGTYYIVVKHLNSIETWSKAGGEMLSTFVQNNYDFTSAVTQAYGNNMKLRAGKYCFYSGDVNQSGFIEGTDFLRIANAAFNFEVGLRLPEDLDGSGLVDATDFSIVDNNALFFIGVASPLQ